MADLEEVAALLHVHEKAHAAGHTNIAGAALSRLRQINAEHPDFGPTPTPSIGQAAEVETVAEPDEAVGEEDHEEEQHDGE